MMNKHTYLIISILICYIFVLPVDAITGTRTLNSGEKLATPFTLDDGDSIKVEVEVTSGTLDISVLTDEEYQNFKVGDTTYHLKWIRDITSSKSFTFTAEKSDKYYVAFWPSSGGSASFTWTISQSGPSQRGQTNNFITIFSGIVLLVIFLYLNSLESKKPTTFTN